MHRGSPTVQFDRFTVDTDTTAVRYCVTTLPFRTQTMPDFFLYRLEKVNLHRRESKFIKNDGVLSFNMGAMKPPYIAT